MRSPGDDDIAVLARLIRALAIVLGVVAAALVLWTVVM